MITLKKVDDKVVAEKDGQELELGDKQAPNFTNLATLFQWLEELYPSFCFALYSSGKIDPMTRMYEAAVNSSMAIQQLGVEHADELKPVEELSHAV